MLPSQLLAGIWVNGGHAQTAQGDVHWHAVHPLATTSQRSRRPVKQPPTTSVPFVTYFWGHGRRGRLCRFCSLSTRSQLLGINTLTLLTATDGAGTARSFNTMAVQGTLCPSQGKPKDHV